MNLNLQRKPKSQTTERRYTTSVGLRSTLLKCRKAVQKVFAYCDLKSKLNQVVLNCVRGLVVGKDQATLKEEVRLLTVRQAATYLGTTPKTLYSWIWKREIRFVKIGRSVRFDVKDLEELIEKSKVGPCEIDVSPANLRGQQ